MSEAAREYIRQAITDFWGERCDIPDDDCPTCMVWAEFDKGENAVHIQRNASVNQVPFQSQITKLYQYTKPHPS